MQVVGLGTSGRAAVKLALARGARVVALDSNPSSLPLEVSPFCPSHLLMCSIGILQHELLVKLRCCCFLTFRQSCDGDRPMRHSC